jgi:hypothetical protein
MKISNLKSFLALVAALMLTHVAVADPQKNSAGVIVYAFYQGFCFPIVPPVPPHCFGPQPYSGTFSIFTTSGDFVASASTDLSASFTVPLMPGRYEIVPDDPLLADAAATVIVRGHRYTEILIWLPPQI